jgi:5-methylcytosine-specific restriction endonuclease McrA
LTPFSYPKSRHTRRLRPGPFKKYWEYKPFLREEFEKKCVYCRMPDTMKDQEMYGVDHYRPKSLFSELLTTYTNLFYCCNPCNRRKREYWPMRGKIKTHFIPNPCDHEMFAHLRFAAEKVQARTTAGAWTRELLDLDDPEVVQYRRFILEALELYEGKRKETRDALEQLHGMRVGRAPAADIDDAIAAMEACLGMIDRHIARLEGR